MSDGFVVFNLHPILMQTFKYEKNTDVMCICLSVTDIYADIAVLTTCKLSSSGCAEVQRKKYTFSTPFRISEADSWLIWLGSQLFSHPGFSAGQTLPDFGKKAFILGMET